MNDQSPGEEGMDEQDDLINVNTVSNFSSLESLPIEIAQTILDKLPFFSLFQCKLLSKTFSNTISNLPFELNKDDPFLFFKFRDSLYFVNLDSTNYTPIKVNTTFQLSDSYIIGSCNGYLCMSTCPNEPNPIHDHVTLIFNPFIRQQPKELPSTPMKLFSWGAGFGYNPNTNEHKVVRVFYERNGSSKEQYVCILSLGTNYWRTLNTPFGIYLNSSTTNRAKGVYLNGWMYWLGELPQPPPRNPSRIEYVILGLDFGIEEFQEIRAPKRLRGRDNFYLIGVRGRLALVAVDKSLDELKIWFMESHGSWRESEFVIRRFLAKARDELIVHHDVFPYDVICFLGNERLWMQFLKGVLCYDFARKCFVRFRAENPSNLHGSQDEFEAILHNGGVHGIGKCN